MNNNDAYPLINRCQHLFHALNADFFDGELTMPRITVRPSSRFYVSYNPADELALRTTAGITVSSGAASCPMAALCTQMLKCMVRHYNATIAGVYDVIPGNQYHNLEFALCCAAHGLICTRTKHRGYAEVTPSPVTQKWISRYCVNQGITERGYTL